MITGATSGLGLATTMALAGKPYDLILTWHNHYKAEQLRQQLSEIHPVANITLVELDLSSFESIEACNAVVQRDFSSIDVLFNNAGLFMDVGRKTAEDFEMTLGVNYVGPAYLTWLLLPLLKCGHQPQILQMSSRAALYSWFRDRSDLFEHQPHGFRSYAVSKRMLLMLTLYLADTLKPVGITVNAIHPGAVATSIFHGDSWLMRMLNRNKKKLYQPVDIAAKTALYLIENDDM